MNWNEIRIAFLASGIVTDEFKDTSLSQRALEASSERHSYRFSDFMLGAEAMYKFLSSTFGDDLK